MAQKQKYFCEGRFVLKWGHMLSTYETSSNRRHLKQLFMYNKADEGTGIQIKQILNSKIYNNDNNNRKD